MQETNFTQQEWSRQDVSAYQPSPSLLGRMENSTGAETPTDQRDVFYFKTGDAFYSQNPSPCWRAPPPKPGPTGMSRLAAKACSPQHRNSLSHLSTTSKISCPSRLLEPILLAPTLSRQHHRNSNGEAPPKHWDVEFPRITSQHEAKPCVLSWVVTVKAIRNLPPHTRISRGNWSNLPSHTPRVQKRILKRRLFRFQGRKKRGQAPLKRTGATKPFVLPPGRWRKHPAATSWGLPDCGQAARWPREAAAGRWGNLPGTAARRPPPSSSAGSGAFPPGTQGGARRAPLRGPAASAGESAAARLPPPSLRRQLVRPWESGRYKEPLSRAVTGHGVVLSLIKIQGSAPSRLPQEHLWGAAPPQLGASWDGGCDGKGVQPAPLCLQGWKEPLGQRWGVVLRREG